MPNANTELRKYYAASNKEIYAKALHFSNLCYLALKANDDVALKAIINISQNTSPALLSAIGFKLAKASKDKIMDTKQIEAINIAKWCLLDLKIFSRKLSTKAIIELGKDPELCRLAVYRLIQLANPEAKIYLNHKLLRMGVEQTSEQVARMYKKAQVLPEELLELASSMQNAHIIMAEISEHAQRFGLTEQLIKSHPKLVEEVAISWKHLLSSNELGKEEKALLDNVLDRLEKDYPQFKGIRAITRTRRTQLSNEEKMIEQPQNQSLSTFFSLIWGIITGPQALAGLNGAASLGVGAAMGPLLIFAGPIIGAKMLGHASTQTATENHKSNAKQATTPVN